MLDKQKASEVSNRRRQRNRERDDKKHLEIYGQRQTEIG